MAYNAQLAERVRNYLLAFPEHSIEEKKMFGGLAFKVNGKMCVNVSGDRLMCRFDPALQQELSVHAGYEPLLMKGKELKGYCYVHPAGIQSDKDFKYWIQVCLDYNPRAKASK